MDIVVGGRYRLIENALTGPWGGAEVEVTEAYEEGSRTFEWLKEPTYTFEIVDRDSLPPYDSEVDDSEGTMAWKGLAFADELLPLDS